MTHKFWKVVKLTKSTNDFTTHGWYHTESEANAVATIMNFMRNKAQSDHKNRAYIYYSAIADMFGKDIPDLPELY